MGERCNRYGRRLLLQLESGTICAVPPQWTDLVAPDPELVGPGLRLLELLDWRGVAMIECKRQLSTGRFVVMEVNGRFWGSLQLAVDAGVDFPTLLVRCAVGEPVVAERDYRIGVRSRWFWGDVDQLYLRLRRCAAGTTHA